MNNKMLERWKLKTKGIFHKIVYDEFWLYIDNLMKENKKLTNQLKEFKEEHKIMKQILIENGLWERLLNDDRFLKYLRDDEE